MTATLAALAPVVPQEARKPTSGPSVPQPPQIGSQGRLAGYHVPLACPSCGGRLEHVTASRPIAGTEASAIAHCAPCRTGYQVLVHLRPLRTEAKGGCGTEAGYQRHVRHHERVCEACTDAHAVLSNPDARRRSRPKSWEEQAVQRRARVAAILAEDDEGAADE
jgi:hypothetical protein